MVVLVVHDERIELMLQRWFNLICLRRGSVLLYYGCPGSVLLYYGLSSVETGRRGSYVIVNLVEVDYDAIVLHNHRELEHSVVEFWGLPP